MTGERLADSRGAQSSDDAPNTDPSGHQWTKPRLGPRGFPHWPPFGMLTTHVKTFQ